MTSVMNQLDDRALARWRSEGNHRQNDQSGSDDQTRSQNIGPRDGSIGDHVLLAQELGDVGDRLNQAPGPNPIRAGTYLQEAQNLTLGEGRVGNQSQDYGNRRNDLDQRHHRVDIQGLAKELDHQTLRPVLIDPPHRGRCQWYR